MCTIGMLLPELESSISHQKESLFQFVDLMHSPKKHCQDNVLFGDAHSHSFW